MGYDVMESIANALSTITIMSCLFLKVPQIMNIKKQKSAEGIFVQSLLMEITGFSIMTLYNYTNQYSLMTYLEYPIILVQVYVMLYYVLKYKNLLSWPMLPVFTGVYTVAVLSFALGCLPKYILNYLVPFCTPLSGFAKVSYIYGIIVAGNANAVSLTTWVISVATNLARIFTVYVDSADKNLIINFSVSTILSSGVFLTALYYQTCCVVDEKSVQSSEPKKNIKKIHSD